MADATVSRLGQIQQAGAVDALFLKIFSGEVLTAYEKAKKFRATIRNRTIRSGKSAQFPATFIAKARYHSPGTEIVGQKISHNEVTVLLDDMLISDVFIAQIDELKNHYDVRAPYSTELGRSLALFEDRVIANCLVKSARNTTPLFTGDGAGKSVTQANVGGSADFGASGTDLIAACNLAKQKLDEDDVPVEQMPVYAAFKPAQWYLMANSDKNLDRDYGGDGSLARQALRTVSDINIIKANSALFGKDVTPYDAGTNTDGLVGHPSDVDALPADYPTKYHSDQSNTRGVVYVEPAVALLTLLGLTTEQGWDMRRQGTLMLAKMAIGADALRSKCAVEVKTS